MNTGNGFLLGICLLICSAATAESHHSGGGFEAQRVTDRITMLQGKGGNIGVSHGEDGLLVVDADYQEMSAALAEKLEEIGGDRLRFVLNTHWHGDHTGGNPALGKRAPIIAHANVRSRVSRDQEMRVFQQVRKALPKEGWPVITFETGLSLHFNGEEIRLEHFPNGHTDGDAVVFFTGSNVVHMGDHFFAGRFPFIDREHGGSVSGLIANVKAILERLAPGAKIIPGHGPLTDQGGLSRYYRMLTETAQHVRQQKASGMTLEEAVSAGLPERWEGWGGGFVNQKFWITTLYEGV